MARKLLNDIVATGAYLDTETGDLYDGDNNLLVIGAQQFIEERSGQVDLLDVGAILTLENLSDTGQFYNMSFEFESVPAATEFGVAIEQTYVTTRSLAAGGASTIVVQARAWVDAGLSVVVRSSIASRINYRISSTNSSYLITPNV